MAEITYINIERVHPHPYNPRKELGDLQELSDSIKANGIFQNLTVIPFESSDGNYTVIIGHRRLAAAKLAGLTTVPCTVTHMTAKEQMQTMLLENMQRSDLTVYEQAQGFQMMLDLGSSIEEIAEKSGFSQSTVRRRVKMMELDQDTLKDVSKRQLALSDFDRLAQIENIEDRNQCLKEIGTHQFNQSVTATLRRQNIKKNLPAIKKLLKAANAKALKQNDTWSTEYSGISSVYIGEWEANKSFIPEKVSDQLFYYLDEDFGRLQFFEKRKRAAPQKRTAEEIDKQRQIDMVWNSLNEKAAIAYNLRAAFVRKLVWNKKNAELILRGALIAGVLQAVSYMGSDNDGTKKLLGIDTKQYVPNAGIKALAALQDLDEKNIPAIIYALFGDSAKEGYFTGYKGDYPRYDISERLNGLYNWLIPLGYEMSNEEKALRDGTHELFQTKAKEINS